MKNRLEQHPGQQRLLSLYAALVECDHAVIRSTTRGELFDGICQHLVKLGEMDFAWIGMADVGDNNVWPQAHFGEGWNYFEFMQMSAEVKALPRNGPADVAIRENRAVWSADMLADPRMENRWELAKTRGWHSAAVLPLTIGGKAMGALSIYAKTPNAFGEKECNLLVQLASNISYAMDFFELDFERKKAEYALIESEVRYSALFASNCMPMMVVNPADGRIVDANIKAVNFYGWNHSALTSMCLSDINAMSPEEIRAEMAHAVKTGKSYFNFHHRLENGELRDVEVFTSPISFGGQTYLISAIHDVTERHRLEVRVRDAQSLMQRFIDQLPGTAFIKDSQLRLLMANRHLGKMLGVDPQSLIGKTAHEIFPPEFAETITQLDHEMLARGGSHTYTETYNDRHNETSMFVLDDGSGQRLLGGLSFDVTERYRASERSTALLRINALSTQLAEKEFLTAGLELAEKLTRSKIGFLHFVNDDQETLELVTWTSSALKGCTAAFDTHYPASQAGIWADCLREGKPVVFNDYASYTKKKGLPPGHVVMTRLTSVPIVENGKVRLMLGVGNKESDYTDFDVDTLLLIGNDLWRIARRSRAETALRQRLEELVVVNKKLSDMQLQLLQSEKMASIGQLASGVAHEINNPIGFVKSNLGSLATYVKNLAEIIESYEAAEKELGAPFATAFETTRARKLELDYNFLIKDLSQLIEESREGVQRVSKIVLDLKNFSRSGDGAKEWSDIHAGMETTINIVWNQLKYKVEVIREYGTLPLVRCVASQINQVVMNLLINAEQAIADRGHITLRTGVEGDQVWFEVQDDGCGISPENQVRIFEPFYTSKPVGQGTGLGLSITFGIIQQHQGTISVQSAPGQGSTFRVTLPIESKETAPP
jgi:PAS domain S-box-containing protein